MINVKVVKYTYGVKRVKSVGKVFCWCTDKVYYSFTRQPKSFFPICFCKIAFLLKSLLRNNVSKKHNYVVQSTWAALDGLRWRKIETCTCNNYCRNINVLIFCEFEIYKISWDVVSQRRAWMDFGSSGRRRLRAWLHLWPFLQMIVPHRLGPKFIWELLFTLTFPILYFPSAEKLNKLLMKIQFKVKKH